MKVAKETLEMKKLTGRVQAAVFTGLKLNINYTIKVD